MLVARREERLRELAAPRAVAGRRARELGRGRSRGRGRAGADPRARHSSATGDKLDLLVNNAGAAWRKPFAEGGYENVRRTMAINFDAQVRLTEALLGLLRSSAPSAIVNVASHRRACDAQGHRRLQRLQGRARVVVGRAVDGGATRTACTSGWCCPGSSPPRGFPSPS